ncbi:N-acetylglucosamine-6-phosphate deacetylase, partial [Mesorhizobium sp. M8A.F.Ca.ET.023.01.1.1]
MSDRFALTGARIFDGDDWHEGAALVVRDGLVEAMLPLGALPGDIRVIDIGGGMLVPGFVDIQVNGGGGVMLNDHPDVASIETICRAHAPFGTTALLPTLITDTPAITAAAIAAGEAAALQKVPGFLGLHLEGPHLSIARKGAHDPALIRPMTDADQAMLIAARRKLPVLLTTIAPESVDPARVTALAKAG